MQNEASMPYSVLVIVQIASRRDFYVVYKRRIDLDSPTSENTNY